MADTPENPDGAQEQLGEGTSSQSQEPEKKNKIPPRVLLICIIIVSILVLSISGWFLYKHFTAHPEASKKTSETEEGKEKPPESNSFVSVPEIIANLRSTRPKGNILRTNLLLQLYKKEDEPKIKEYIPVILDQMISYLRDQSVSDLEGPGLERMRQAILLRVNNILRPLKIYRVLLKDFIIQ